MSFIVISFLRKRNTIKYSKYSNLKGLKHELHLESEKLSNGLSFGSNWHRLGITIVLRLLYSSLKSNIRYLLRVNVSFCLRHGLRQGLIFVQSNEGLELLRSDRLVQIVVKIVFYIIVRDSQH